MRRLTKAVLVSLIALTSQPALAQIAPLPGFPQAGFRVLPARGIVWIGSTTKAR